MKWLQADLLKELREAKGWSQKQLAEVAGISQQAIAHWELGDREPSATSLFALCRALGVSCESFAPKGVSPGEPTQARPRGRPRQEQPGLEPEKLPVSKKRKNK